MWSVGVCVLLIIMDGPGEKRLASVKRYEGDPPEGAPKVRLRQGSRGHLKMSETFAAAHASRNIIETVSLCDETMFTSTCALQLNSPRHNKRLMGGGCYSCRVVPLLIFHVSPDHERILI